MRVTAHVNLPAQTDESSRVGEVQACVLAEQFRGHVIVGPGRVDFVVELAQPDRLPVETDGGLPLSVFRIPRNPFELRSPATASSVPQILGLGTHPEIAPAVVPFIAVDVIDHPPRGRIHEEPVHENGLAADPGTHVA
jgi:hypothetical protein